MNRVIDTDPILDVWINFCIDFRQHLVVQVVQGRVKEVRKHCRVNRHATKSPISPPPHTHTETHTFLSCTLSPHALSRAGSCSPVERHRARGEDWRSSGGKGVKCTKGERWWGGGDERWMGGAAGAALGGQWQSSQACQCASCSPLSLLFLSLLPPPLFSLSVFG